MPHYFSTNSIESAYHELNRLEINNPSILHIFFILKACNISRASYMPASNIADLGLKPAIMISRLFSPDEELPKKYDFISPFHMKTWSDQPTEPLIKWVRSRIKNNVIGGATTWRSVIDYNSSDETIKFKYEYIKKVKDLTLVNTKLNIYALSIWSQRFTPFEVKIIPSQIIDNFRDIFKITDDEINDLFSFDKGDILFEYNERPHDASHIRSLIGLPESVSEQWIESKQKSNFDYNLNILEDIIMPNHEFSSKPEDVIKPLLQNYSQVILAGPPGTSKSYLANNISSEYPAENVVKVQFHPSYSYQNFIGGYVVEGVDVQWSDGVLFALSEIAKKNNDQQYLLIIDEINRANVGQVFGETIQCLDRNNTTSFRRKDSLQEFSLPENLKIIGTMNTADRTIGAIDFAIQRRFATIYSPSNPSLVDEMCSENIGVSLGDFLRLLNNKLLGTLKNKELTIGHTFFMNRNLYNSKTKKFFWSKQDFELLFNYKILPLIEDYTGGNQSQLVDVLDTQLPKRLSGKKFIEEVELFLANTR